MNTQEYATARWVLDVVKKAEAHGLVERVAKEETIRELTNKLNDEDFKKKYTLPHEEMITV